MTFLFLNSIVTQRFYKIITHYSNTFLTRIFSICWSSKINVHYVLEYRVEKNQSNIRIAIDGSSEIDSFYREWVVVFIHNKRRWQM